MAAKLEAWRDAEGQASEIMRREIQVELEVLRGRRKMSGGPGKK